MRCGAVRTVQVPTLLVDYTELFKNSITYYTNNCRKSVTAVFLNFDL